MTIFTPIWWRYIELSDYLARDVLISYVMCTLFYVMRTLFLCYVHTLPMLCAHSSMLCAHSSYVMCTLFLCYAHTLLCYVHTLLCYVHTLAIMCTIEHLGSSSDDILTHWYSIYNRITISYFRRQMLSPINHKYLLSLHKRVF